MRKRSSGIGGGKLDCCTPRVSYMSVRVQGYYVNEKPVFLSQVKGFVRVECLWGNLISWPFISLSRFLCVSQRFSAGFQYVCAQQGERACPVFTLLQSQTAGV